MTTQKKFVDFTLPQLGSDSTKSLQDYSGKTLLVNFWATWCAPCVAELPSLQELAVEFADREFAVVAISVDSPSALPEVNEMVERFGLTFDVLLDADMNIPPKLGITGFPESFFVGPNGELLEIYDPLEKKKSGRIVSDRDWSSKEMMRSIAELLPQ